jgi:hypothetical protein
MRWNDWIPLLVLGAMLVLIVGLSVEAVADPPRSDGPAADRPPARPQIETVLDAALGASSDAVRIPGTTKSAATTPSPA